MTRKHFEALAEELAAIRPRHSDSRRFGEDHITQLAQWQRCVLAVGNACGRSNGAFDRARFEEACNA